ncbi:MAG: DUF2069 domain-containing protein [Betaproteobacteria bacterium]|nr:DUF2069 domain-containing protein [Betaproteobacteria bacterium]
MNRRLFRGCALACLLGLLALSLAWELWLAPLRPGGSWLVLKALPLLAPLFGVIHERRYTFQWASMFILIYLAEGLVRSYGDLGTSRLLAGIEIVLSVLFFISAIAYARGSPLPLKPPVSR